MKYLSAFVFILSIILLSSCGKKSQEENPGGAVPLGKGMTIPVLKTEKARRAKLTFDLTEVIRKDDKVDVIVMITNRGDEGEVSYNKEELALTDNNGYIYKVRSAKLDKVSQFSSSNEGAKLAKGAKVKSIISFEGVREDATSAQLFFKGTTKREKDHSFKAQFNRVQIK